MSSMPWETEEERNYICMDHIVNDVASKALRGVFIQEWNNRYQASFGAWDNTTSSGNQLFHREKTRDRPNKTMLQSKFADGDTNQWNCYVLFDAILYSNSIGLSPLNPITKNAVDKLRNIRNEVKHIIEMNLSDADFQSMSIRVENAFKALHLPVHEILVIKVQRKHYKSFRFFPLNPGHEIVERSQMMKEVSLDLQKMRTDNYGELTYFYISGNPGSGKSIFARQVCENVYNSVNWQTEAAFVMTLNAKDLNSLLYSYHNFCQLLSCNESVLQNIMNSASSEEEKIKDLRLQITTRITNWKWWWLIVDNVEDLENIAHLLPQTGNEIWKNGQIILTTQNTTAIPCDRADNLIKQISLSRGMDSEECRELLSALSKTDPNNSLLDEVAQRLDCQPLAMAAAAVYFRRVKEIKSQFSWPDYLLKLENGQRYLIERQLSIINSSYASTMSAAVLSAVEKCAQNLILKLTFVFLSLVSFEELPVDIIVNFIQQQNNDFDAEEICLLIHECSLFLCTGNENRDIRLNHVVHESIKTFCDNEELTVEFLPLAEVLVNVVRSLYCFQQRNDQTKLIPHLKAYYTAVRKHFPEQVALDFISSGFVKTEIYEIYLFFGRTLRIYREYKLSKNFFYASLRIYSEEKLADAGVHNELGLLHANLGEQNVAKKHFDTYLDIKVKQLGHKHPSAVYRAAGDLKKVQEYYQREPNIREEQLGHKHPDTADSYNNLGIVYQGAGNQRNAFDSRKMSKARFSQ